MQRSRLIIPWRIVRVPIAEEYPPPLLRSIKDCRRRFGLDGWQGELLSEVLKWFFFSGGRGRVSVRDGLLVMFGVLSICWARGQAHGHSHDLRFATRGSQVGISSIDCEIKDIEPMTVQLLTNPGKQPLAILAEGTRAT